MNVTSQPKQCAACGEPTKEEVWCTYCGLPTQANLHYHLPLMEGSPLTLTGPDGLLTVEVVHLDRKYETHRVWLARRTAPPPPPTASTADGQAPPDDRSVAQHVEGSSQKRQAERVSRLDRSLQLIEADRSAISLLATSSAGIGPQIVPSAKAHPITLSEDPPGITRFSPLSSDESARIWSSPDVDEQRGASKRSEQRLQNPSELFLLEEWFEEAVSPISPDMAPFAHFVHLPVCEEWRQGVCYRLLPKFEGESLASWISAHAGMVSPDEVLTWVRSLAEALSAIHDAGRLHLHLFPDLIWRRGDGILFTGVNEFVPIEEPPAVLPVMSGFSSPEAFGNGWPVGVPSDIFSLTMLIFFMITGRIPPTTPMLGNTPVLTARDLNPAFPLGWQWVLTRGAHPVPAQRFSSVQQLLDALESSHASVLARCGHRRIRHLVHVHGDVDTHIGITKRLRNPVNQDCVVHHTSPSGEVTLTAIADGVSVSTFGSGELASGIVAKQVDEMWGEIRVGRSLDNGEEILREILIRANVDIIAYVNEHFGPIQPPIREVMGSTALLVLNVGGEVTLMSTGDSRAYLATEEYIERISRDHNLFTVGICEGFPVSLALRLPQPDALARCVGSYEVGSDGMLVPSPPAYDVYKFTVIQGDCILLGTDGLFDFIGNTEASAEERCHAIVQSEPSPALACLEMILDANRGGGGDNISVGVLRVL